MDHPPLWRRIVNFPLVAMILAIAVFLFAGALADLINRLAIPPIHDPNLRAAVRAAVAIVLLVAAYKLIIARLGQHPRDDLPASPALKPAIAGLGLGFAAMAAAVGVAALLHVYRITGRGDTALLGLEIVGMAIIPGFTEELLFRGILFRWLEELSGSWIALAITSALFGAIHILNPNATWFSSLAIAIEAGAMMGGAYMLTRNLWMPMGLHAGWNLTQGELFDVPVSGLEEHGLVQAQLSGPPLLSGGGFGLEASIIGLVVATAAGSWLVWLAAKRGLLIQPLWVRHSAA
jgi:membrane protease YdiL (CAAX protease family)